MVMFWFNDEVVIFTLYQKPKQGGVINRACLCKQRGQTRLA